MSQKKNINSSTSIKISWIQFICSLIIITDHSFDYLGFGNCKMDIVSSIIYFITQMFSSSLTWIAMQTFFILSGFLMFKDWNERKSTSSWYFKKVKSRTKSLLIPYFLWNIIWTFAFIAIGLSGTIENNIDATISVSNIFHGIVLAKYNEVFWFMEVLILYTTISPLIGHLMSAKHGIVYLVLFSFIASNLIPLKDVLGEFVIIQTYYNLFFYCLGAFISIQKNEFINKNYSKYQSLVSASIVFFILILLHCCKGIKIIFLPDYILMIFCIIGTYSFWITIDFFRNLEKYHFVKYSFLNYAMHKPIQQFYNKLVARFFTPSLHGYLINLIGGGIITVLFVIIFVRILYRFTPRLLQTLNGGREISM